MNECMNRWKNGLIDQCISLDVHINRRTNGWLGTWTKWV